MSLKPLCIALGLVLAASTPALAQRGDRGPDRGENAAAGNWELLGEEKVGFGVDRDVIRLPHNEDHYRNKSYRRLRFVAEGGDLRLQALKLVYLNGHSEDLAVNQTLRPGQQFDVDLKGERSYLQQIEMVYGSRFGLSIGDRGVRLNLARVKVYGDNARGGVAPPMPKPPMAVRGWDTLAQQAFDRRNDQVELKVGRRDGRFGQIALHLDGERVSIREVRIRFGNGQTQTIRFAQELEAGVVSSPIDLAGEQRFIDSVTVVMNPGRRFGQATVTLLGTERAGAAPATGNLVRPSWLPLGKQTVGYRARSDVIRVGQSEEWFGNRGFDKLHFVVTNNDVEMGNMRITYLNGYSETIAVNRVLRSGSSTEVDLPGRRSFLREIEMTYRARPTSSRSNRAEVNVYGEPVEWRR